MKNKTTIISVIFVLALLFQNCNSGKYSLKNDAQIDSVNIERGDFRVMFYNCENFFDIFDDSLKLDDEFTPDGAKHWSWNKYQEKLGNLSRVITSVGGWEPPDIVGLCEVENYFVLNQLTNDAPLSVFNYKIIHYESPDSRGIDVALLYIPAKFRPIFAKKITVNFPASMGGRPTRDILYVKGLTTNKDTLHIYVNHWPSRWGGMLESEEKRMFVGSLLRANIDSVFATNAAAKIIIMGDLNDFPTNKSITDSLRALHEFNNIKSNELYNLSYYLQETKGAYSHKYQGESGILDQMIISGALLDNSAKIYTTPDNAHIYNADFLLEDDNDNVGYKPFRTYIGYKYHGGYSDHLPAYLDLFFQH
ncbi:MAG: endonuclease [Bacteroidales bacterium]|nr:endonuclease [Bacteroidales bacterium]